MLELFFYRDPETIYEYDFVTCRCNYKYVVMAFSYFFGLTGCALVGGGVLLHFDPEQIRYLLEETWYPWTDLLLKQAFMIPFFLDVAGVVVYVIGVLGATASLREDICKTLFYYVILLFFYTAILVSGTWLVVIKVNVHKELEAKLRRSASLFKKMKAAEIWLMYVEDIVNDRKDDEDEITTTTKFNCCGGLPFHSESSEVRIIANCLPNVKYTSCLDIVPDYIELILQLFGALTITYGVRSFESTAILLTYFTYLPT
ncbi:hypothetical protein LSAT2_002013 [Lamellibrachia satsuma]|nr:hypothetical protein LSAT2_002013 [Lamellibrachia satsuma]